MVVDDSGSMAEEQASLVSAFPALIESLLDPADTDGDTLADHKPVRDLHVGVIGTDMGTGGYTLESCSDPIDGDDGELRHEPGPDVEGCDAAYPTYLSYESEEPDAEMMDWVSAGFGCIATLGTEGCSWEQHLKAAARALIDHRDGVNAGFLRPDSILFVLFVTDEDDCSVARGEEDIFDVSLTEFGHHNLRCFRHPEKVEPVSTFVSAFESIRPDPDRLILGFIVGVPPSDQCEGQGNEITGCLDHPDMIEAVDPVSGTRLMPSCYGPSDDAYPPRRLVQVAQHLGERAIVSSVCTDDFGPALGRMTGKLQEEVDGMEYERPFSTRNDPPDPCRCVTSCRIVESLSDARSCESEGRPCWDPDGTGCAEPEVDPDGIEHTLCEIPQAGTRMEPCEIEEPTACSSPAVIHSPDGVGWYYMDRGWADGSGVFYSHPRILFTEGMEPLEGSDVRIECEAVEFDCVGPSTGRQGSGGYVGSACTPLVCPEGPSGCRWDASAAYFAESLECEGGACMIFRTAGTEAYCSRRCGPGAEIPGCPSRFECMTPVPGGIPVPGCWCVDRDLVFTLPEHPDARSIEACN